MKSVLTKASRRRSIAEPTTLRRRKSRILSALTCPWSAAVVGGIFASSFVTHPLIAQDTLPATAVEALPAGTWTVVGRAGNRALLAARPQRQRAARLPRVTDDTIAEEARHGRTVEFVEGFPPVELRGSLRTLSLPDAALAGSSVRARFATFAGRSVAYAVVGEGPHFRESPTGNGERLFEHAGTSYRVDPSGAVAPLVEDTARGFDRSALRLRAATLTRDGESAPLLWATAPQWSPDGQLVAFATNREAIAAGRSGQSLWVANGQGGGERPLLVPEPGESFTPLGWLGREVLYGQRSGGVWAIDPANGQRRQVSSGAFLAVDSRGGALAIATPTDAGVTISVLQAGTVATVPAPPTGYRYEYFGAFSPTGVRLALVARTGEGAQRLAIYTLATRQLDIQEVPGAAIRAPFTDPPAWLTETRLLVNAVDAIASTERSYVIRAR